ncbi:MAG: HIT domain-containing protein [Nitrososphaeria archaeon]
MDREHGEEARGGLRARAQPAVRVHARAGLRVDDAFCRISRGEERAHFARRDDRVFVIMDRYPLSRGQALVIPREHFTFFYELPEGLVHHFYSAASAAGRAIRDSFSPDEGIVMLARGLRVSHVT